MINHFLTSILMAMAILPAAAYPVGNIKRYLSNSARTDLIGPDLWTTLREVSDGRVGHADRCRAQI